MWRKNIKKHQNMVILMSRFSKHKLIIFLHIFTRVQYIVEKTFAVQFLWGSIAWSMPMVVECVMLFVRCGALHVGDQVLSINDVPLDSASVSEAMRQLQCDVGDQLVLEILPKIRTRTMRMMSAASSLSSNSSITCQFCCYFVMYTFTHTSSSQGDLQSLWI